MSNRNLSRQTFPPQAGRDADGRGGKRSGGLKRALGALDLTMLGIGAIVGAGIFVLTGVAAAKYAGPAVTLSFVVSGFACAMAALCYAEFAAMIPIAGSAYSYSYATMGELVAWIIGWDLVLEYAVGAAAVAVGWSGYLQVILKGFGIRLPSAIAHAHGAGPGGVIDLPALLIVLVITAVLYVGISESARLNSVIVAIKLAAIALVIVVGAFYIRPANWSPFAPMGWTGVMKGAAVIFFAYIGFDAVSTAAEEVIDPNRDLPIGILASLFVCTALYILVAAVLTGMVPAHTIDLNAPLASAFVHRGLNAVSGIISLGAVAGSDFCAAGAAARAIPGVLRGLARRIAAGSLQPDPSALPDSIHPDNVDRNCGRDHGRAAADSGNRGAYQYRHAVRVRVGMPGADDSALDRAGNASAVSHSAGAGRAESRRDLLFIPDAQPAGRDLDQVLCLDGDRIWNLFRLRTLP